MADGLGLITNLAPVGASDELTLVVGGTSWSGWQRVNIMRSLDTIPANFTVEVTEKYPVDQQISILPGAECEVMIGGDVVVTGYVDRYFAEVSPASHTVRISGRSKSEDLVDAAAFFGSRDQPTYMVHNATALSIAQQLAGQYGVGVNSIAGPGKNIPEFAIQLGETAWEVIDRVIRYSNLLAYDMPDGSVMLAQAGSEAMSSGFVQGVNVERAEVDFTMDQRFSEYEGFKTSAISLTEEGDGHVPRGYIVADPGVPRFRRRIIISEQTSPDQDMLKARVEWEAMRRMGRSMACIVTCDSWRDGSGTLWQLNHLAPIYLPVLKIPSASWVIGQIVYTRDEDGQHAVVTLMPKEAFLPEPTVLWNLPPREEDLQNPVQPDNPTAP